MVREDFNTAMTNRSLRTIKAELEFLADANLLTQQQLTSILSQLPAQPGAAASTPSANLNTQTYYEKTTPPAAVSQPQPPPAYPVAPAPPSANALTYATALYAYAPSDAGDLALQPNDRIAVTEYMNAEWWKGRSERTGQEGIFPRNYVKAEGLDARPPLNSGGKSTSSYGNVPLEVSQSGGGGGGGGGQSRISTPGGEAGKKFGKKLGNAAVFGAGATLGGKIVNGIF